MKLKSKFKKLILSVLSAACVGTAAFGVAGCMPKSIDKTEPTDMNVRNDRLAPPTDGSLPTAYSAVENLAFVVGKFDTQTQYHTYTEGVTSAAIATQVTRNWKDYKDGILVNSDITFSSMVKGGTQTCTVFGKDEEGNPLADTYFRTSETPTQDTTSTSAVWKQDAPTYFSESAYLYTYGFLPNELFNYAVNSDTLISSEEIKVESDGTYTLKFTLDPVGSTFYYQFGMKTRGGLSGYPEFQFIEITVNFDKDWQINSSSIHEVSKVNKGIVVDSVSDFTSEYYYGEDHFDNEHFGYYENYYKKFLGDSSLAQGGEDDGELVMDVTNVLSNGFASILNGGQQFQITANLGNNKYVGYVFIGLDLADIAGSINLKVSLGKTLNTQNFYVEYAGGELSAYYGEDFGIYANLAEVKLQAEQFGSIIDKITAALSSGSSTANGGTAENSGTAEEGGDPLTALMDSMVLTADENQATLSLKTDDLLGLGIGIDANLQFGINGKTITFRGATIGGLSIGGEVVDLDLGLKTTTAPLISHTPEKTPANLADYVADVYSLLSSDLVKVSAELNGNAEEVRLSALKGVNVKVDAYADLSGITLGADATASYTNGGNTVSAKVNVIYEYNQTTGKYGKAYLSLKELNGTAYNVNVCCDVDELITGISALINSAGNSQGASSSLDTGKLINALNSALSSNFSSLLTDMYADGSKIKIGVSVDTVLDMLGVDAGVRFGSCELAYAKGQDGNGGNLTASLPSMGFSLAVNGAEGEIAKPNQADYLNLSDILNDVKEILDEKAVAVNLSFDGAQFKAANVEALKDLSADAQVVVDLQSGLSAQVTANVTYKTLSAQITANYVYNEKTNGLVVLSLDELCGVKREVKVCCNVNEIVDGVKSLLTHFGTPKTATLAAEGGATGGIDISTVLANLLTADIKAIIPNLEAKANVLDLSVNVDEVLKLLGVSVDGLSIGKVDINYDHNGKNLLSVTAPNFGVAATVNTYYKELPEVNTANALNLADVLADVNSIVDGKKLAVSVAFDGSKFTAKNIEQLKNLTASATAYVDINKGIAAQVDAEVNYQVDETTAINATLKVYFSYDKQTVGDAVVVLDSVNGVATSIKLCCNVTEIKTAIETLLTYVAPKNGQLGSNTATQPTESSTKSAANVLDKLINADFTKLIGEIKASENLLNLTVNVDEILKLVGADLGISFGNATLEYKHAKQGETVDLLSATVANLGVSLAVNPTSQEVTFPETTDCMDVSQLVGVVNGALSQIDTIKKDGKLYFEIAEVAEGNTPATYLLLDGIRVQIWGKGEICWLAGHEKVALDLAMSISEEGTDVTTLKLVYDKNAEPMVKLALNNVGLTIYKEDVDGVKNGFTEIYNKLADILGLQPIATEQPKQTTQPEQTEGTATQPTTAEEGTQTQTNNLGSVDNLLAVIFKVLAKDNWVKELNNFTATTDGKSVALGYLTDKNNASVNINTDGGLSLNYNGALGQRFSLGGSLKVTAAQAEALQVSFDGCEMASSKEGETEFIRLAYNFLFDCIHGISVENILGSSTYAVNFELNGANTEVADLQDVYVKAEIYVTDEASENNGKLAEGLLNLDVAGVAINLHVISEYDDNGKAKFYINLTRVADILLPDLKLLATQDSLYETFKVLFNAVTKTDVVNAIKNLIPTATTPEDTATQDNAATDATQTENGENKPVVKEGTLDKVAKILDKVVNLNFSKAIKAYQVEGEEDVQHAEIDLDNLLGQLGINKGSLGSLAIEINHDTHAMTTGGVATIINADGTKEEKVWISLSSEKATKRSYAEFNRDDYLNIEFLPYLLDDVVNFATDDSGKMYNKFTLSGSVTASIVNMFNINIDVANLTISLADNDFYFSAVLQVQKMSALGLVTIPKSTVGISFHGGYLTLARGINTSTPEYRIMTMDYFIDHMLVKNAEDSVLKWWLNVSGWDTVIGVIQKAAPDLNVSSGLTTPQDVYLYNQKKEGSTQLISMYDYVEALRVMVGGKEYASFGNMTPLQDEFGISDNYYGFMLNAGKVTGGVLTKLYAAIIRGNGGISTVKASGAIQSYVNFAATLNYNEGATTEYQFNTEVQSGLVAPSMYDKANDVIKANELGTVDYDHYVKKPEENYDEKFGSYNLYYNSETQKYEGSYSYSHMLYSHTLTVVEADGTKNQTEVRHGSTVHLYDNAAPAYADEAKTLRLLYTTQQGTLEIGANGKNSVVMNADLTVYALKVKAVNVIATSGSVQHVITSFLGDKVPTEIEGLETIGKVTYADGTEVGANDKITEERLKDETALRINGVFVQSLVEVDGVNYEFNYDNELGNGYYTVVGKAESFDTTLYCGDNAKTLVLQNEIDGYPVTKIGKEAFANLDGHALKKVVVPANIVTVDERAFLDNVGMESVVFRAGTVTILGSYKEGEDGNTTPFYGCSAAAGGITTNLKIFYNTIVYEGSADNLKWTKFRRDGSGAIYKRYYIGCDPIKTTIDYDHNGGGKLVRSGWDYVNAVASVDLNGVTDSSLTVEAAQAILDRYYPVVSESSFTSDAEIEAKLAVDFAQFDMTKNGINYKCVYTTENVKVNGFTTVTYKLTYTIAKTIKVYSNLDFNYYGTKVVAGRGTDVTVDASIAEVERPSLATHDLIKWEKSEVDGVYVYTAEWKAKEFKLSIMFKRGFTDTNVGVLNDASTKISGGQRNATEIYKLNIYGGNIKISVKDYVLTVDNGDTKYTLIIYEADIWGNHEFNKRKIKSDVTGEFTVTGNMTLTLTY